MNSSPSKTPPRRPGPGLPLTMAAAVAVIGLTASIVWAAVGLSDQTRRPADMATTSTPGTVVVQIARPGTHVVYLERAVSPEARGIDYDLGLIPSDVTVTGPDGQFVDVRPYTLDLRYDSPRGGGGVVGQAFAAFDAGKPGKYVVATEVALSDATALLAVGDDLAPGVLRAILLPALTGVFALAVAIAIAARALILFRRRNRRTAIDREIR